MKTNYTEYAYRYDKTFPPDGILIFFKYSTRIPQKKHKKTEKSRKLEQK